MRIRTKVAALAVAGSTAGLLAIGGVNMGAQACGSAAPASGVTGLPPSGANTSGTIGVNQGGNYAEVTGTAGPPPGGDVTLGGSTPAGSGALSVGNDGNQSTGTVSTPSNPTGAGACAG